MKLFKLDNLCIIKVAGERAADYLQGQVSCDIRQVTNGSFQHGALCNLKGRILALMDIIKWNGYQLILPKNLADDTISSLEKTALLSRVKLSIESNITVLGLYCEDSTPFGNYALAETPLSLLEYQDLAIANLGNSQYLIFIESHHLDEFMASFPSLTFESDLNAWHALRLQAGHCSIHATTKGSFLPQRLNLDQLGYLSFNKGCYRGQEVIARMHYRAKTKHELVIQKINRDSPLTLGTRIVDAEGQTEIGELIDSCPLDKGQLLIAASLLIERPATLYFEGESKPIAWL